MYSITAEWNKMKKKKAITNDFIYTFIEYFKVFYQPFSLKYFI